MTPWVVFTVAARNFIPHARVLHDALQRHHPGVRFVLGLCDVQAGFDPAELGLEVMDLPDLHDGRVWDMARRYNITELCTAIKPMLFRRLMARFPGAPVVYMDPDIAVVSPMTELQAALDAGDAVAATARRPEQLHDLVDAYGDNILPLALDVTDVPACAAAIGARSLRAEMRPRIAWVWAACSRIMTHSASSSFPGLSRIALDTPSLPMS